MQDSFPTTKTTVAEAAKENDAKRPTPKSNETAYVSEGGIVTNGAAVVNVYQCPSNEAIEDALALNGKGIPSKTLNALNETVKIQNQLLPRIAEKATDIKNVSPSDLGNIISKCHAANLRAKTPGQGI